MAIVTDKNKYPCDTCNNILCHQNCHELNNWLCRAEEALREKEKYRWHDLRKDPDDLPPYGKSVFVAVKNGMINRTWHDEHGWRNATSKRSTYYQNKSVMAWKYIEPFEENTDDRI